MPTDSIDSTLEDLEARHRREKRDLVTKISALKRTVPKGDKRKKKEVSSEIAALEAELKDRHNAEIKDFGASTADSSVSLLADAVASADLVGEGKPKNETADDQEHQPDVSRGLYASNFGSQAKLPGAKKNKAKLRQQRKAEEMKRMQEEAERDAENMVDVAAIESEAIANLVAKDGLAVHEIRADGHCLYSAIADQISTYHGQPADFQTMRKRAADYMRQHRDDFMPFMVTDVGDMFDEPAFDNYCDRIESTADWGGHQEITALSHALETPIYIYQTGMPVLRIGDDDYASKDPIKLSYHRHAYGLGEHYNSLHKVDKQE
ncbi:OTU protein [Coemansia sp. RSA 2703]|nr:OTU protein [Coemansia sp. RSA 2703]KAJ2373258.1 OTU protein [Coemansia sp. RSA 2607]KAJ2397060.1 OTU protein [Coemansia sp. RSA 2603]